MSFDWTEYGENMANSSCKKFIQKFANFLSSLPLKVIMYLQEHGLYLNDHINQKFITSFTTLDLLSPTPPLL